MPDLVAQRLAGAGWKAALGKISASRLRLGLSEAAFEYDTSFGKLSLTHLAEKRALRLCLLDRVGQSLELVVPYAGRLAEILDAIVGFQDDIDEASFARHLNALVLLAPGSTLETQQGPVPLEPVAPEELEEDEEEEESDASQDEAAAAFAALEAALPAPQREARAAEVALVRERLTRAGFATSEGSAGGEHPFLLERGGLRTAIVLVPAAGVVHVVVEEETGQGLAYACTYDDRRGLASLAEALAAGLPKLGPGRWRPALEALRAKLGGELLYEAAPPPGGETPWDAGDLAAEGERGLDDGTDE